MHPEDLALEDVERAERNFQGEISRRMANDLHVIKQYLRMYEVGQSTLLWLSDEMYKFSQIENQKEAELLVKTIADRFWD